QEENGSWAWSSAPAKNRPPPFFESDEVATQLTYIALGRDIPAEGDERTAIVESRKKAADWLATITPEETTQSSALNLLINVQAGQPPETIQPLIEKFIGKQNEDGGWGQLDDRASDAYATGQALYALNLAGVKPDRQEIQRAVEFLVKTQNEDGSWPMTRRGHPGVTPGPFVVPLTYFGSVWGTMGLMRTVGTAG
ncbi:MAG: prenyltransferase/squalene oxidase repeat-containing protein, partial [Planctomycetaceae bacterium]